VRRSSAAAAVVSLKRLAEPPGRALLVDRLAKEAVHEMGHAFGLVHCGQEHCVMSRSPAVREVDAKGKDLCSECRTQLDELAVGA
jgi:archaemetzincin